MAKHDATSSASRALRQLVGQLTLEQMDSIMAEQKKETVKVTRPESFCGNISRWATPKQMEDAILLLLDNWQCATKTPA